MVASTPASKKKDKARTGHRPAPSTKRPGALERRSKPAWAEATHILWPRTPGGRWAMLGILAAALALRAYHLLSMFPVLMDESIYLRWAEIIDNQGQWFISLLDGKQPLTYWILALVRMTFGGDPLLEGRLVSVAAGLLSTLGIFAVGRHLGGEKTGLLAAGLYAVFPYALLYDRLAYTESFVNLAGVAIVLTSLVCFAEPGTSWRRDLAPGLALGLGLFAKQTVVLFAFFPALAGVWLGRRQDGSVWPRLARIYGIAGIFVVLTLVTVPEAPTLQTHDAVLHDTRFFVQPSELLADPLQMVPSNLSKLLSYVSVYLTWPVLIAAIASLIYLTVQGVLSVWLVLSVSLLPWLAQVFVLEVMFPTRYPFPHSWPWLVVLAMGATAAWQQYGRRINSAGQRRAVIGLLACLVAGPLLYRSICMLRSPRECLHAEDSGAFLGSSALAGFGVREAVEFLKAESRNGPFVLLTDPIWGPPADAIFAFLNQRYGIRAYEAWWMQLSGDHTILPKGKAELLKSHYERVKDTTIDFSRVQRVFYVTDTNYAAQSGIPIRQPDARLVASFPKPNQQDAIQVYRLK